MNILITGGAGYIGYSIVRVLAEDKDHIHSITIYDNLSRRNYSFFTEGKFNHKSIKFIQGDILDGRMLQQALQGIDCVVHLAAKVTTPFADTEAHSFDQVNHWGSAQLAFAIENSNVSKIIYMSSISIYGDHMQAVDETTEPNPHSFYGRSKLEGERQLSVLGRNRELYLLRSGNVYGYNPAYRIDAVVNRFLFQANFLGKITINGSGEQHRSFIHVDKVAHVVAGLINGSVETGIYNLVEHNQTINQIAESIKSTYSDLDLIYANHNVRMKDVLTALPCRIWSQIDLPQRSFMDELIDFKSHFSF
jgi:UDP-glucose 4-epimerase